MSHMHRLGQLLALTAVLLLPLVPVFAASASSAPAPAVGVVNLDKIAEGYKGYQAARERLMDFGKSREDLMSTLKDGMGLSLEDFKDFQRRVSSAAKIEPEKIKQLVETAKKRKADYDALYAREKANEKLTDAEQAQLKALSKDMEDVTALMNQLYMDMQQEIDAEVGFYKDTLTKLVNDSIGDVAKKQKLGIVLNRTAQTREMEVTLVLWGGTDITNDVVKTLNDGFKLTMLDKPAKTIGPEKP